MTTKHEQKHLNEPLHPPTSEELYWQACYKQMTQERDQARAELSRDRDAYVYALGELNKLRDQLTEARAQVAELREELGEAEARVRELTQCAGESGEIHAKQSAQVAALLAALKGLLSAYAPNAERTAFALGEQALQSDVQRARAAIAAAEKGES